jgi:hypothetical protein
MSGDRELPVPRTGRGAFMAGWRARSVGASLVDPRPADTPAGVLPWRNRPAATAAALPGGTCSVTRPSGRVSTDPTEPDRAGAGHGQPGTPWAEMLQVRLPYPLADRHPLPAVPRSDPACAASPAHKRKPPATPLALALSHPDPFQFPYAGLPLLTAGPPATLPTRRTPERRAVNQASPAWPGRRCQASCPGVQVHARRPDPPPISGSRRRVPMTVPPVPPGRRWRPTTRARLPVWPAAVSRAVTDTARAAGGNTTEARTPGGMRTAAAAGPG